MLSFGGVRVRARKEGWSRSGPARSHGADGSRTSWSETEQLAGRVVVPGRVDRTPPRNQRGHRDRASWTRGREPSSEQDRARGRGAGREASERFDRDLPKDGAAGAAARPKKRTRDGDGGPSSGRSRKRCPRAPIPRRARSGLRPVAFGLMLLISPPLLPEGPAPLFRTAIGRSPQLHRPRGRVLAGPHPQLFGVRPSPPVPGLVGWKYMVQDHRAPYTKWRDPRNAGVDNHVLSPP